MIFFIKSLKFVGHLYACKFCAVLYLAWKTRLRNQIYHTTAPLYISGVCVCWDTVMRAPCSVRYFTVPLLCDWGMSESCMECLSVPLTLDSVMASSTTTIASSNMCGSSWCLGPWTHLWVFLLASLITRRESPILFHFYGGFEGILSERHCKVRLKGDRDQTSERLRKV